MPLKNKHLKVLIAHVCEVENLKHHHLGTKSSDLKYQNEVLKSRSWHYCWSKFYFHKKHYNYLIAFSRTLPNFIKAIKLCIYYKIKKDNINFFIIFS